MDEAEIGGRLDLLCTVAAALEMKITRWSLMDGRNSIMRSFLMRPRSRIWAWRENEPNGSRSKYPNEYIHLSVTNYKDNQCFICHNANGCRQVIKQSKRSERLIKELAWKGRGILTVITEALLTRFICRRTRCRFLRLGSNYFPIINAIASLFRGDAHTRTRKATNIYIIIVKMKQSRL